MTWARFPAGLAPTGSDSVVPQAVAPSRAEQVESRNRRLGIVKSLYAAGLELTESMTQDGCCYLYRISCNMTLLRKVAEGMGARFKTKLHNSQEENQKGLWPGFAPYVDENRHRCR